MRRNREIVVKEWLTPAENQRYIRFKIQDSSEVQTTLISTKTEWKGRGIINLTNQSHRRCVF